MPNRTLTDKFIRSIRPAPKGKRVHHWDKKVPGFGVRVTDSGHKSYVLYVRWPGGAPSRRRVGDVDKMTLATARKRAKAWLDLVENKIDPKVKEREELEALAARKKDEKHRRQTTFGKVAEDWFEHISYQRKARDVERDVRKVFIKEEGWGNRPITDITREDVEAAVSKRKHTPGHVRNLLAYAKRLFTWATSVSRYNLKESPAEKVRIRAFVGDKGLIRTNTLSNEQLRALWLAAEETPTPYSQFFKLLVLTGQRRNEVAHARWREFDFRERLWTIPAERMKMKKPQAVPLTDEMVAVLQTLPRFDGPNNDYLFSTQAGKRPINSFGGLKYRAIKTSKGEAKLIGIDSLMLRHLGLTERPPRDEWWTIHDIRRTVRTNLSALRIPTTVAEMMIAHAPRGIQGVYDRYAYLDERREGFEQWAARLHSIIQPPPDNVVPLQGRRA